MKTKQILALFSALVAVVALVPPAQAQTTPSATLRIQKTRVGTVGGPVTFNFTGNGPGTGLPTDDSFSFTLTTDQSETHDYGVAGSNSGTPGTSVIGNLVPGTYVVAESFVDGNNNNYELTNVTCVNQAGGIVGSTFQPTYGSNGGSVTIDLVAGANYLCTFTNNRNPNIVLTKSVQGAGAAFPFTATASGTGAVTPSAPTLTPPTNGTAQSNIIVDLGSTASRNVTLTEGVPPAGYALSSASCTKFRTVGGVTTTTVYAGNIATRQVTILDFTANDTAACNFVNVQQARVAIRKQSNGGTGSFSFTGGTNGLPANMTLTTATPGVPVGPAPFVITTPGQPASITETVPPGWTLTSAQCVTAGGATVATTLSNGTLTIPGGALTGGSNLTCTFTNGQLPTLRLRKALPNGRFAAGDQFTLSIAGAASGSLTTNGTGTTANGLLVVPSVPLGGSYTFSEAGDSGASLANYATTYGCTNAFAGGTSVVPGSGTSFSVTPQVGDDILCVFTNTRNPLADLAITKTNNTTTVTAGQTTTYTVVATNNGPDAADGAVVTDTPGAGLTGCSVTGATPAGGAVAPATPANLLTTGAIIPTMPNGGSVTFTVQCAVQ